MTGSILSRTARSAGWIIAWRISTRILGLASTLVLVRVLLPQDFGLVALGAAFAQTVEAFSNLGTDDALVREPAPTRSMYDTAFTLNAIRGLLTGLFVAVAAWPTSQFFDEPRLGPLLLALAALAVVDGFVNVGIVDFRRNFEFHKELLLNILPRLVSVVVAVSAALLFRSYWALIAGQATYRVLRIAASYRLHQFRPQASLSAWRGLMVFSAWTWLLSTIQMMQVRVDSFIIGRALETGDVGAYALGAEIALLPTSEIVDPLGRAAYSGFSATFRDGGTEALFYRLVANSLIITLPIGIGLSMVADPLVRIALGERWLQVVPVIQILSVTCGIATVGNLSFMLLRSHGHFASICGVVFLGLVVKVVMIVTLLRAYGLAGAAMGAAAAVVFESAASYAIATITQRMPIAPLFARCWRIAAACGVMVGVLMSAGLAWAGHTETTGASILRLAGSSALGVVTYVAALYALWIGGGRPEGAEADMLATAQGMGRRLRGRQAIV